MAHLTDRPTRLGSRQTALHFTASKNNLDTAKKLVAHKASARVKDKRSQLALHRAAAIGSVPMLKLLLDNRSPLNATDVDGMTALHHGKERAFVQSTERGRRAQYNTDSTQRYRRATATRRCSSSKPGRRPTSAMAMVVWLSNWPRIPRYGFLFVERLLRNVGSPRTDQEFHPPERRARRHRLGITGLHAWPKEDLELQRHATSHRSATSPRVKAPNGATLKMQRV